MSESVKPDGMPPIMPLLTAQEICGWINLDKEYTYKVDGEEITTLDMWGVVEAAATKAWEAREKYDAEQHLALTADLRQEIEGYKSLVKELTESYERELADLKQKNEVLEKALGAIMEAGISLAPAYECLRIKNHGVFAPYERDTVEHKNWWREVQALEAQSLEGSK